MKQLSLLALLFSSVLLLSACQKAIAPADESEGLPVNSQIQSDARPASDEPPTESPTFNFDKIVEASGGNSTGTQNSEPSSLSDSSVSDAPASSSEPQVKSFSMTARQWEFIPGTITVNEGDRVLLSITSVDVAHGFALKQFGVSVKLEPGKTETVEFVADKKGTYSFFCNVLCGSGHGGMRGTLVVQ